MNTILTVNITLLVSGLFAVLPDNMTNDTAWTTESVVYLDSYRTLLTTTTTTIMANKCLVDNNASVSLYNPDELITEHIESILDTLVNGVMLPLLLLVNIPTNCISMTVFYRQGLHERVNLCLFCLSFSDLAFLLQCYFIYIDRLYLEIHNRPRNGWFVQFYIQHKLLFLNGFAWASGFTTTIISCERCLCIISPLRSQSLINIKTTALILAGVYLTSLGVYFVLAFKWSMVCVMDPITNSTSLRSFPSDFYLKNKHLVDVFEGTVLGLAVPGLCIAVVTLVTCVTIARLRQLSKWRNTSASSMAAAVSARDFTLSRMLVGISVLFVASRGPTIFLHNVSLFVWEVRLGGRYHNTYNALIRISQLFVYIKSSFNFFIYYNMGSRYRRTAKGLFCKLP